jgi:WD40 repeat protein
VLEHFTELSALGNPCWWFNVRLLFSKLERCHSFGRRLSTTLSPHVVLSPVATSCKGYIAASNIEGGFDIYDLRTHLPTQSFPMSGSIPGVEGCPASGPVLFVHNGRSLVGGTKSGDILLWDVENGIKFQALHHHGDLRSFGFPCNITDNSTSGRASISAVSVRSLLLLILLCVTEIFRRITIESSILSI